MPNQEEADAKGLRYGVIDETGLSFRSPREVDEAFETLSAAFKHIADMIDDVGDISIVRCRFSEKQGVWYEVAEYGAITIDATRWADDEEVVE